MKEKIISILGSVRFWMITMGAAAVYAGLLQAHGFQWPELFNTIAAWLGTVAGVGTVDKFGQSIGVTKDPATGGGGTN